MATAGTPDPKATDPAAAYQDVYDALGKAYWEASSIDAKDQVHAAMEEVYEILTAYDEEDLADDTDAFNTLKPQIDATNVALKKVQTDIDGITKKIGTAASVVAAIAKVLSLIPSPV